MEALHQRIMCDRCNKAVDRCVVERDHLRHLLMISVSCHGEHDVMSISASDTRTMDQIMRGDFLEARAFVRPKTLGAPSPALAPPVVERIAGVCNG